MLETALSATHADVWAKVDAALSAVPPAVWAKVEAVVSAAPPDLEAKVDAVLSVVEQDVFARLETARQQFMRNARSSVKFALILASSIEAEGEADIAADLRATASDVAGRWGRCCALSTRDASYRADFNALVMRTIEMGDEVLLADRYMEHRRLLQERRDMLTTTCAKSALM
jgi:hypothetical protein